jgi:hypothetical protein
VIYALLLYLRQAICTFLGLSSALISILGILITRSFTGGYGAFNNLFALTLEQFTAEHTISVGDLFILLRLRRYTISFALIAEEILNMPLPPLPQNARAHFQHLKLQMNLYAYNHPNIASNCIKSLLEAAENS